VGEAAARRGSSFTISVPAPFTIALPIALSEAIGFAEYVMTAERSVRPIHITAPARIG